MQCIPVAWLEVTGVAPLCRVGISNIWPVGIFIRRSYMYKNYWCKYKHCIILLPDYFSSLTKPCPLTTMLRRIFCRFLRDSVHAQSKGGANVGRAALSAGRQYKLLSTSQAAVRWVQECPDETLFLVNTELCLENANSSPSSRWRQFEGDLLETLLFSLSAAFEFRKQEWLSETHSYGDFIGRQVPTLNTRTISRDGGKWHGDILSRPLHNIREVPRGQAEENGGFVFLSTAIVLAERTIQLVVLLEITLCCICRVASEQRRWRKQLVW